LPIAQAGNVVFIATEILTLCCPVSFSPLACKHNFRVKIAMSWDALEFKGTKLLVDDLPYNFIGCHLHRMQGLWCRPDKRSQNNQWIVYSPSTQAAEEKKRRQKVT
jgi:hypothetical protein